jgi:protein-tyrosine phosphatase
MDREKIPKNHKYPTNKVLESKEKTIIISKIRFLNFLIKLNSILNEKSKIAREELHEKKKSRIVCSYPEFDFTEMKFDEILQEIKEIREDRI